MKQCLMTVCAVAASAAFAGTYYVDVNNGNDDWDGTSETRVGETTQGPMKTLVSVLGVATNSGDIVYAAAGTYSNGTMTVGGLDAKYNGLCRAAVADGVTLQSKEGAEKTIILGQEATSPVSQGCGSDSVRGVFLDLRSKLIGFTVTGGRARYVSTSEYGVGGGVCCRNYQNWYNPDPVVSDCIITNNAAYDFGGGYMGVWVRTRFVGNRSFGSANNTCSGVGGSQGIVTLSDCYINDNNGSATVRTQVMEGYRCYNTTFGPDGDKCCFSGNMYYTRETWNCVFLGDIRGGFGVKINYQTAAMPCHRCAFLSTIKIDGHTPEEYVGTWGDADCLVLDAGVMRIDSDGRLRSGSALIDVGSNNYHTVSSRAPAGGDVYGGERIVGPAIDLGAVEFSLKGQSVDRFGFSLVTAVTGAVSINEDYAISLANDAAMTITLAKPSVDEANYRFSAQVAGAGMLGVFFDGSATPAYTVTSASGTVAVSYPSSSAATVRLAFSGGDATSVATISDILCCSLAVIQDASGLLTVTGATVGTNYVAAGGTLTFTVNRTFVYPNRLNGVWVNNVYRAFDAAADGMTLSFTVNDADPGSSLLISTVSETLAKVDWYVDDNGSDSHSGMSRFDAFKTLKKALENTDLQSGETVWALPGTYDEGTMEPPPDAVAYPDKNKSGLSRLAVKGGVTLRSTEGAEKTIIKGAPATVPLLHGGCGADSVRCAYVAPNAKLIGFTLTGGYARYVSTSDSGEGGGICIPVNWSVPDGIVQDCIISNNCAYTYGGAYGGYIVGCHVVGNTASSTASGIGNRGVVKIFDTYVNGNTGAAQVYQPGNCVNVTFGPDGAACLDVDRFQTVAHYVNCVFLGEVNNIATHDKFQCDHCVFADVVAGAADYLADASSPQTDCRVLTAEELALGQDCVPTKTSALVGTASRESYETLAAVKCGHDALGVPRVLNGNALDVGGFEYDWRKDYAKDLARCATVTDVSTAVVETADNRVRLTDGTSLTAILAYRVGAQALASFSFAIAGEGTLMVKIDGEVRGTFVAGDTGWNYRTQKAVETVTFSFAGEGHADLGKIGDGRGFMMLIR